MAGERLRIAAEERGVVHPVEACAIDDVLAGGPRSVRAQRVEPDRVAESDRGVDAGAGRAVLRQRVAGHVHSNELAAIAEGGRGAIGPAEAVRGGAVRIAIEGPAA